MDTVNRLTWEVGKLSIFSYHSANKIFNNSPMHDFSNQLLEITGDLLVRNLYRFDFFLDNEKYSHLFDHFAAANIHPVLLESLVDQSVDSGYVRECNIFIMIFIF